MHGSQIRLRDHLNSMSHHSNSAHAVEHDGDTEADLGVGRYRAHPLQAQYMWLPTCTYTSFINARRACARGLQYLLCVCVCSKFAAFKWRLYNKVDLPACFSPVFLDFQLKDLSKMPSFQRKSAFHGYFVVYNPHKRLCILLVV